MRNGYGISFDDPRNLLCQIKDGNPQEEKYFVFDSLGTIAKRNLHPLVVTIAEVAKFYRFDRWFLKELKRVKDQLEEADVTDFQIITRPMAASYFFKYNNQLPEKRWMVIDLGKNLLTATLFMVEDDIVITQTVAEDVLGKSNTSEDDGKPKEEVFDEFSEEENYELNASSGIKAKNGRIVVVRLINEICMNQYLQGFAMEEIERVFIVGSRGIYPVVIQEIEKVFPGKVITCPEPAKAVARGAALYAAGLVEKINGNYENSPYLQFGIDFGEFESTIAKVDMTDRSVQKASIPNVVAFNKEGKTLVGEDAIEFMKKEKTGQGQHRFTENGVRITDVFEYPEMVDKVLGYSPNTGKSYTGVDLYVKILNSLRSRVSRKNIHNATFVAKVHSDWPRNEILKKIAFRAGIHFIPFCCPPDLDGYGSSYDWRRLYTPVTALINYLRRPDGGFPFGKTLLVIDLGYLEGFAYLGVLDEPEYVYVTTQRLSNWCDPFAHQILLPWILERYSLDLNNENRFKTFLRMLRPLALRLSDNINLRMEEDSEEPIQIKSAEGELGFDDQGKPIEIDLTISVEQAEELIRPWLEERILEIKDFLTFYSDKENFSECFESCFLTGRGSNSALIAEMLSAFHPRIMSEDFYAEGVAPSALTSRIYCGNSNVLTGEGERGPLVDGYDAFDYVDGESILTE